MEEVVEVFLLLRAYQSSFRSKIWKFPKKDSNDLKWLLQKLD